MSSSTGSRLRLHVTPAAERAVRRGHPWVYADRIASQNRPGTVEDLAVLYDGEDRFLALGLFDPFSPIRVRVLHAGSPVKVDAAWWRDRLDAALQRRRGAGVFDDRTTGHRWIHGESDGWPGLVLDRYGDVLVLKLYSVAWVSRLPELVPLLVELLQPRSLVLRLSRNVAAAVTSVRDGQLLAGEPVNGVVVFLENGIRFEADVVRGQKTGFFLDQRENRARIGALAAGAEVLNAFSFSGGFSLYAARGGARSVLDLDISPHALASAKRNFALNMDDAAVAAARHEVVQADTFEWLAERGGRTFDLIVLDPPSLAKRETEREGALAAYERLAFLGAQRLRPGGRLLAASCSAHVTVDEFFAAVQEGVRRSGRRAVVEQTTRHPVDHPATFAEAWYLKGAYLRLDGAS
ncbi:MAG: class I SAM-dependent methyltransferase [Verrucomicrobiales bacterium]|nr:class I SAM-dependent methyltransferase [Verrucomicrobiales bacterium]